MGMSVERMMHNVEVARKCYDIAKRDGYPETFCKKMWMIGYIHDVGYEFTSDYTKHAAMTMEVLNAFDPVFNDSCALHSLALHDKANPGSTVNSVEWRILCTANLTTNTNGQTIDASVRIHDLLECYGELSPEYRSALKTAQQLGLVATDDI